LKKTAAPQRAQQTAEVPMPAPPSLRRLLMARYGRKAAQKVRRAMHERKEGTLRSGGSGKKVTSRKQAIAIGLSEARREGGKVPPNPNRGNSKSKSRSRRKTRSSRRKRS
jgi:Family of unknown function (DUF6496)